MYRVVPSPLGGVWLQNENGVVVASGTNVHALRMELAHAVDRREFSPFMKLTNEFGEVVLMKDYVRI